MSIAGDRCGSRLQPKCSRSGSRSNCPHSRTGRSHVHLRIHEHDRRRTPGRAGVRGDHERRMAEAAVGPVLVPPVLGGRRGGPQRHHAHRPHRPDAGHRRVPRLGVGRRAPARPHAASSSVESHLRALARRARELGVAPVLAGVLADRHAPEVVRARAFSRIVAALGTSRRSLARRRRRRRLTVRSGLGPCGRDVAVTPRSVLYVDRHGERSRSGEATPVLTDWSSSGTANRWATRRRRSTDPECVVGCRMPGESSANDSPNGSPAPASLPGASLYASQFRRAQETAKLIAPSLGEPGRSSSTTDSVRSTGASSATGSRSPRSSSASGPRTGTATPRCRSSLVARSSGDMTRRVTGAVDGSWPGTPAGLIVVCTHGGSDRRRDAVRPRRHRPRTVRPLHHEHIAHDPDDVTTERAGHDGGSSATTTPPICLMRSPATQAAAGRSLAGARSLAGVAGRGPT